MEFVFDNWKKKTFFYHCIMVILLATLSIKDEKRLPLCGWINSLDPERYKVCNINKLQYNNWLKVFFI